MKKDYERLKEYYDFQRKKEYNKDSTHCMFELCCEIEEPNKLFDLMYLQFEEKDYQDPPNTKVPKDPKCNEYDSLEKKNDLDLL